VSLLTEPNAFLTEHVRCSGLDAGVEDTVVWIACDCGARMASRVDEADDAGLTRRRGSGLVELRTVARTLPCGILSDLMDNQDEKDRELRHQSRRLADASRQLVEDARAHIESARARLEQSRNLLQLSWLRRTLRDRPGRRP
jgi:hypothetical protein